MAGRKPLTPGRKGTAGTPDLFTEARQRHDEDDISTNALDEKFARLMVRLNGPPSAGLLYAARKVSAWRSAGHSCLPLRETRETDRELIAQLRQTRVVGVPGEWKPLVLDAAGRLYLHRYWQYERDLAQAIHARVSSAPPAIDCDLLEERLSLLFDANSVDQRNAAEAALTSNLCVITGGPGTGKTRTAATIVGILHSLQQSGKSLRIAIAAPTGKAAARATEAMTQALARATFAAFEVPEAVTVHRLLGASADLSRVRYHSENPVPFDVVIIDESSMVDLAMMARLFAAVPPSSRLILLGDKDQLASVEAGRVLGDLCTPPRRRGDQHALARSVVVLKKAHRFSQAGGIHQLSGCVNAGDSDGAMECLASESFPETTHVPLPAARSLPAALADTVLEGYSPVLAAKTPEEALAAFARFRILCAHRSGPFGVEQLNRICERTLASARLISSTGRDYHGRPVLITRNDYNTRLFNGDIGLMLIDPEAPHQLRVFFASTDGGIRKIAPSRLPAHQAAWALTVHKSQGSEFEHVLLMLADDHSPLLTRELLYTGLTRARSRVQIWSPESVLKSAIATRTERSSGLRDALWSSTPAA